MTLIAYAYAAAAEVVLFYRERELFTWAKLARDTVIAGAGVRLLGLGDIGLGRGVAGQGLHAAALRDSGVRLDEVAGGDARSSLRSSRTFEGASSSRA